MTSFLTAVETFLDASESWLSDEDAPATASLRAMAEALDGQDTPSPGLLAQYGLAYRNLLKRKPEGKSADDELDALLSRPSEPGLETRADPS